VTELTVPYSFDNGSLRHLR